MGGSTVLYCLPTIIANTKNCTRYEQHFANQVLHIEKIEQWLEEQET